MNQAGENRRRRSIERVVRRRRDVGPTRVVVGSYRKEHRRVGPTRIFVLSFLLLVAAGTVALMLPWASTEPGSASLITALFTSTSATFVTGLIVVETGTYWTGFGQAVILTLIELGGLGYMAGFVFIVLTIRGRVTLEQRQVLRIMFGGGFLGRLDVEARFVILLSLAIQLVGIVFLLARFVSLDLTPGTAIWQAVFHSVSAFHNAGFDITAGAPSVEEFRYDTAIIAPIAVLALVGALGMNTVLAILAARRWQRLTLDAKFVLLGMGVMIVVGFVGFLALEWSNVDSIGGQPFLNKAFDAFAVAVGGRTSGFDTFSIATLKDSTHYVLIVLMLIGGASGSMTGGIKVNVLMVMLFTIWSSIRGETHTVAFKREIPSGVVRRALALVMFAFIWVTVGSWILSAEEGVRLIDGMFEIVSAFALVGLSTGITTELTLAVKLTLIVTMVVGRLAPFLIAMQLSQREEAPRYRYARETVSLG